MQLAFGRLVSLFSPHIRVPAPIAASLARRRIALRPPDPPAPKAPTATDFLALDPVRGVWTLDERQRRLWPRLRANTRFLAFLAFLGAAALTNTLLTPRLLGRATLAHPRAALAAAFTAEPTLTQGAGPACAGSPTADCAPFCAYAGTHPQRSLQCIHVSVLQYATAGSSFECTRTWANL